MARRRTCTVAPELRGLLRPIGDLASDPANLRLHGERSLEAIAASLRRFGQQRAIVIDEAGTVVAGNGVLAAAVSLGWTHIAATGTQLAGVERVAYAIADNRLTELSEWDQEALRATLGAMPADALAATGFTAAEIERIAPATPVVEDQAPEPLPIPVSRPGDLWVLGEHRLLCGDSTKADEVQRCLGGELAALVATDPPYVVDYTGERGKRPDGKPCGKDWSALYREIDIPDAGAFFRAVFTSIAAVLAPNAALYCWHAHRRQALIAQVWEELGLLIHQQIIWVKPAAVFGRSFWHHRHEPCLMGWRQGSMPAHDDQHLHATVWEVAGKGASLEDLTKEQLLELVKVESSIWEVDWEGKARVVGNEHPTQKPVELFARPMRKHTAPGAIVFEPFSGSGTQLIAAEQLGRRCRAIELQPVFVDVAIRRWQALTGKAARLESGDTWAQVAQSRKVPTELVQCPPDPPTPADTLGAKRSRGRGTAKGTKPSTPRTTAGKRRARPTPAATAPPGDASGA